MIPLWLVGAADDPCDVGYRRCAGALRVTLGLALLDVASVRRQLHRVQRVHPGPAAGVAMSLSREETLVDLPPKARAVDAAQRALNELPPDVLTAAAALGAIHALHAIVPVIVERLRQDAAGNQPSQRMDSWDCADLIEREFGKAP